MDQSISLNGRSILIVEDEAIVRFNLADFFEQAGYHVTEAESADEAIVILNRDSSISVVLTDVHMPGSIDGLKLAHYVRDRFPPTVLVVTSGESNPRQADLPTDSVFVPKPFDPQLVLDQIKRMAA
ncbi:MAG: response regulator [Sandarakinorhabdus sp.]|nr:response regulator [Sandarakinorhabdus sp.]